MSIDFSQVFNLDFDSNSKSVSDIMETAKDESTELLTEKEQKEITDIKDEYSSSSERAEKYQEILEKLDSEERDAALYLIGKDKKGAAELAKTEDISKGITSNKEDWLNASTLASVSLLKGDKDLKGDVREGIKNNNGVVENDTLYEINEKIKKDSNISDEEVPAKTKELLKEAGISDVGKIKEIKGSSSSSSTRETDEAEESGDSKSLEEVKTKYEKELNDTDSALYKEVKAAYDKDPVNGAKLSARGPATQKMIDEIAGTFKSGSRVDGEYVKDRLTYINNNVQDIVRNSDEFPGDAEVRVMSYFEDDKDGRILAYLDDGDGNSMNNDRIEGLYIDADNGNFEDESGNVIAAEDGEIKHNGKTYDVEEIVGNEEFQLYAGKSSEKDEVEKGARNGWKVFQDKAGAIAHAQGDEEEAKAIRERAEHQDKFGAKEILMLIAGIGAIVGGIIASSSGGRTHTVHGRAVPHQQYPQQFHQPIGYNPGIGGGIHRGHPLGTPVNQYANAFRAQAKYDIEMNLYGYPKTSIG